MIPRVCTYIWSAFVCLLVSLSLNSNFEARWKICTHKLNNIHKYINLIYKHNYLISSKWIYSNRLVINIVDITSIAGESWRSNYSHVHLQDMILYKFINFRIEFNTFIKV